MKPINHLKELSQEYFEKKHPNVPIHALPKTTYSDRTANGLTKCIIDFIQFKGGQAERINVISRQVKGRFVKSTMTIGTADISATIPIYTTVKIGLSVKIEIKIGRDRQSKEQKQYEQDIINAGGMYYIAKDFNSFYEWYNKHF